MYVVAGASGHVGSAVADELLNQHESVRVLLRDPAKGAGWAARDADVAIGSLEDAAFLTRAFEGARGIFVLVPEDVASADFHGVRRRIADAIVSAVHAARVPHVVMISSVGADVADGNGPIQDLHYLESRLKAAETTLTSVRASYFQENVAGALMPARHAGIVPNFGPSDSIPFPMTATRDAGVIAAHCLMRPPAAHDVVDVVGPRYTMRDVADKLGEALGKPLQVVNIPEPEWVPTLRQAGMSASAAEAVAEMFRAFGAGKLRPSGNRRVEAITPIDDVIQQVVRRAGL